MNIKQTLITTLALGSILSSTAFPAFAKPKDMDEAHKHLIHVGLNPAACTGPFKGDKEGKVEVETVDKSGAFEVEIRVHDAVPNKTYDVDVRCHTKIGSITTDDEGDGKTEINVKSTPSSPFFIDISIPGGGGGAGGYGDTFIAGPFNLN